MKNKSKNVRGITLIALVISIIVILLLAGVTIATLTGDNGILSQAQKAKESTEVAKFRDEVQLAYMTAYAENAKNGRYTVSMENLLEKLYIDHPEYNDPTKIVDGTQGGIKAMWGEAEVNETNGVLVSTTEPETINVVSTSPSGDNVTKFVLLDGKYYEIILNANGVTLGEAQDSIQTSEQTNNFTAEVLTGLSGVTVTPIASENNKTVTISGGSATSGTIKISYGEYDITVKVDVKNLYTVSFYKESGDTEAYATKKVEPNQAIGSSNMPTNPTKDNYVFKNWKVGNTLFDGSTTINANTNVYAEWDIAGWGDTHPANSAYISSFGKKVTGYIDYKGYNANDEWRLFYADSNDAYLIKNSIGDKALNDSSMTGFGGDMTSNAFALGRSLNPQYTTIGNWAFKSDNENVNNSIKGVAALLDTSAWTNYSTNSSNASIANWAIGAPTVEMFIASYNATHTAEAIEAYKEYNEGAYASETLTETQLDCNVVSNSECGYLVKKGSENCSTQTKGLGNSSTIDNAIYCPSSGRWWLASPIGAENGSFVIIVTYSESGKLSNVGHTTTTGVRPIVSVPLSRIGNGEGQISIGDF